jgi:hypothetical protein
MMMKLMMMVGVLVVGKMMVMTDGDVIGSQELLDHYMSAVEVLMLDPFKMLRKQYTTRWHKVLILEEIISGVFQVRRTANSPRARISSHAKTANLMCT